MDGNLSFGMNTYRARGIGSTRWGSVTDLGAPEEAACLSTGCGNPVDTAPIAEGNVVLDLGSGAGIDVFKASSLVGPRGRS